METTNIAPMLDVVSNNITSFNRDIILTDANGGQTIVAKVYCTIEKGKSMSMYMSVEKPDIFNVYKDVIQTEVNGFVNEAKTIAGTLNVPTIAL